MSPMLVAALALLLTLAWGQQAESVDRPRGNIALGATYTLDPPPNYGLCTDAGDLKQLTDGQYTEGYFWVHKSTVGWQDKAPTIITLDLGSVQPIRGVSFSTAGGFAGVEWPLTIRVLVAGGDQQFHQVGDLVVMSEEQHGAVAPAPAPAEVWIEEGFSNAEIHHHFLFNKDRFGPDYTPEVREQVARDAAEQRAAQYGTYIYRTDQLRTHGRYISLMVWNEPFIFVDEIEVYAGDPEWLDEPLGGKAVPDPSVFAQRLAIQKGIKGRLVQDIEALRTAATAADVPDQTREKVLGELAEVEAKLGAATESGDDFKAVLPLNPWHERVMRTQAWLWRAAGLEPLTFWHANLWDPLPLVGAPDVSAEMSVEVHLMRREHRVAHFNVSNSTDEPQEVSFRLSGLPGGDNPAYATVHEVSWTDTRHGLPVAAALPEVAPESGLYTVTVPSGMTRQVWMTFHLVDVPPGVYEGEIIVASTADARFPLRLHLYPFDFPEQQTLHMGGWDYTDRIGHFRYITEQNRPAIVEHLRQRRVDSPWGLSGTLARGTHDERGSMIEPPATDPFDAWIELWPDAAQYMVFAEAEPHFQSLPMGTPEFATAVKDWVTFWADYMVAKGLRPEQLALLLVDEPREPFQDELILAWSKPIRQAATGVRIWEDVNHIDMSHADPEMIDSLHVLSPHYGAFLRGNPAYRDYFLAKRDQGIALEFYAGNHRDSDPYFGRLMAWSCWRFGAEGFYTWSLTDTGGGSSWNEYLTLTDAYAPIFLDATSVTAGKHLEAAREGVQDYEYLVMLDRAIRQASASGESGPEVEEARRLLEALPLRVLKAGGHEPLPEYVARHHWLDEKVDRTLADKGRIQVLAALAALAER